MPFNLLLLPLLGGFLLLHRAYLWRYYLVRFDGHRLIFFSAAAGVALLAASTIATYLLTWGLPSSLRLWHEFVPFAHSGKAFGAFFLGLVLPEAINRVKPWNKPSRAQKAIQYFGNELELLVLRSMDLEVPVLLTLGTGKIYVGYATQLFNPDIERKYLKILPVMSGYRDRTTLEARFTTDYEEVLARAKDHDSAFHDLLDKDFEIVFPVSDIKSVSLFDARAYEEFNPE